MVLFMVKEFKVVPAAESGLIPYPEVSRGLFSSYGQALAYAERAEELSVSRGKKTLLCGVICPKGFPRK